MHFIVAVNALLAVVGLAVAAPAKATTTAAACPPKFTSFLANFDDLRPDQGGQTHLFPNQNQVYKRLYYGGLWQVASPGIQMINDKFADATFNMTVHSGKNAIVSAGTTIAGNAISSYRGGERWNLKSFWVRGQHSDAFTLHVQGRSWDPKYKGEYKIYTLDFNIPAMAYGQYYQIQFNAQQLSEFTYLDYIYMGDKVESQHILIDDMLYCWHADS